MNIKQDINFSSEDFFKKVIARDHHCIEALILSYTEHLYRGALGLGFDSNTAEDLVQGVWTTFYEVVANFKGNSHIRTFIFGILYNKASEYRRDKVKHSEHDDIDEIIDSRFQENGHWSKPPANPEEFMESSLILKIIEKCIDALPLNQRLAFCLKEIDNFQTNDICNILKLTNTNLGVIIYRAKNKLRECIEAKSDYGV